MATPQEIAAAWQNLNNDQRFRELPYEEQQKVRAMWAERNLPNDPNFASLNPAAQSRAFQNLITQAPSFTERNEYVDTAMRIAEGVRSSDPEALKEASTMVAGYRASRNAGPIYQLATK